MHYVYVHIDKMHHSAKLDMTTEVDVLLSFLNDKDKTFTPDTAQNLYCD